MTWLARDAERRRQMAEVAQSKARALQEGEHAERTPVATTGGDQGLLRGIPVIGARGVGGAINGTLPHAGRVFRVKLGSDDDG